MDTTASTMKSLADHIADVLKAAAAPMAFSALKTKLKANGVPVTGKSKVGDDEIHSVVDAFVGDKRAFVHPDKKSDGKLKYWHTAPVSPADKMAMLLQTKVSALGKKLVTAKQLGEPKPSAPDEVREAFATALETLLAEQKLFRHGGKLGIVAPVVATWYDTPPLKKSFADAIKAISAILESGKADFDSLTALLKQTLGPRAVVAETVEPPKPAIHAEPSPSPKIAPADEVPVDRDLRAELKKAYDHLCMFAEFQHGRVEIRRLYHQLIKTHPHLKVADFHKELLDMSRQRVVELHVLNEVKEARDRELAIERNDRLLYYIIWN